LIHPASLPVGIMSAILAFASAHAGSANLAFVRTALSTDGNAGGASANSRDEPSIVIATGDFNRDGKPDLATANAWGTKAMRVVALAMREWLETISA